MYRVVAISLLLLLTSTSVPAHAAPSDSSHVASGPPTGAACLPLLLGTTGIYGTTGEIPTLTAATGQSTWGADAPAALKLPSKIWFKDTLNTVSEHYALALRNGRLFARPAKNGVATGDSAWSEVNLPPCLKGKITGISADHNLLLAVGPNRQVYSHNMPNGDLDPGRWTWRWGPYLWTGLGVKLPSDLDDYATSDFSKPNTFTDSAGRSHQPIGVATMYLLRNQGRRITYLDPWLPSDESREVCLPNAGTTQLAGLDASGSTIFAVTRSGQLYTRQYDFDLSGANTLFGTYSWRADLAKDAAPWQLPIPDWKKQRTPPGSITNRVAIVTTGPDARNRELRVEGTKNGTAGVWSKSIDGTIWKFTRSGSVLTGTILPRKSATIVRTTGHYVGTMGGAAADIAAFDWACTPTKVRVQLAKNVGITLLLHTYDGMRQSPRAWALDDRPREYNGALEVPKATWDGLERADSRVQAWVKSNLTGRITVAPISATTTRLRFLGPCWELTLDGKPARPDKLSLPDVGVLIGRLAEMQQSGRAPGTCLLTSPPL